MEYGNCCFCGEELSKFDCHNPWPAATGEDDDCCGDCNSTIVIPARMRRHGEQEAEATC